MLTRRRAVGLASAAMAVGAARGAEARPQAGPLFMTRPVVGRPGLRPAAGELVALMRLDAALEPALGPAAEQADRAVRAAQRGQDEAVRRADAVLTDALLAYVARRDAAPQGAMTYIDEGLRPTPQAPSTVLAEATAAGDVDAYVAGLGRVNRIYDALLAAWLETRPSDAPRRANLRLNLLRAKALPRDLGARHVLVNIPAQRLDMVERGEVVGAMKVVVGRPDDQTPPLAALIRTMVERPYWNIPPDIVQKSIAPRVLQHGPGYLARRRFEVLSDWSPTARVVDPRRVDWRGAAAGRLALRLRQRPGADNMMGQVKFMFPNRLGVYLHDTPLRGLFDEGARAASHGCVRLEDAQRLAGFLFGRSAPPIVRTGPPETAVALPAPVPVYLAYLTAAPTAAGRIERFPDIYGRDREGRA